MDEKLSRVIEENFKIEGNEGESKIVSLREAVRQNVRPGMALHFTEEAGAAMCEVLRQYWGQSPHFTLVMSTPAGTHAINMIHAGLVKKLIFTNCSDLYPTPRPNPIVCAAFEGKEVELENWSVLSFVQRLIAGAWGIGFMPTKSIVGSDIAEENKDSFQMMDDPFGSGRKLGVVKALNPHLAFVHGWAADPYGNTIVSPFHVYTLWGAKASRNGVVVTVEKIVSTEFIREHSSFVKIPGYMVRSVSLAPLGAHPQGLVSHGLADFEAYDQDNAFLADMRKASEDAAALDDWIRHWVLDTETHEDYLRKLGQERILFLKGKGNRDAWEYELAAVADTISTSDQYTATEMMIVAAARQMRDIILENRYRVLFGGIGGAALAGWLAYYLLKKQGYVVELVGPGIGSAPRPGDPFLINQANMPTFKMLTDALDIHGTCVTGETNLCLGLIGAAQVDRFGNINSTKIGGKIYIAGSGGSNDMASGAREVITMAAQSKTRLVEKVSFITCPGGRVKTLVSNMAIFEKVGGDPEFTLTRYFPDPTHRTLDERIKEIKETCGWDLKVSSELTEVPPPASEELLILRLFDPRGYFLQP